MRNENQQWMSFLARLTWMLFLGVETPIYRVSLF